MKQQFQELRERIAEVAPLAGAWIETSQWR